MLKRHAVFFACLLPVAALAQSSHDQARFVGGEPASSRQRLILTDVPRASGKTVRLFDGRSLNDWRAWLGYTDPAVTYSGEPGSKPVGIPGNESGDFAVRQVDGGPAIWIKGQTWGSLVHDADLSNYHLRLEYKWGAKSWAPRDRQPPNNGLLYHTHGTPGEVFGTWQPSLEFEIMKGSTGMAVAVGSKVRARTTVTSDPTLVAPHLRFRVGGRPIDIVNGTPTWNVEAANDAEHPIGAWNTLDLYVLGNRAVHVVNGTPVAALTDIATIAPDGTRRPLMHGHIQLQSEGAETWFRTITVEPIRSLPKIVVAKQTEE